MAPRPLVLVPPSLTMAKGGRSPRRDGVFDSALNEHRQAVTRALGEVISRATTRDLERVFNARGAVLQRAVESAHEIVHGVAPVVPAWRRYQGVVWTYLDPRSLPISARRHLLIPSGLYGVVSGEDPVAECRLGMNVRLGELASLSQFWQRPVTSALRATSLGATIVNLLPREHAASIHWSQLEQGRRVVHVEFLQSGSTRAVGHDAKAVKGVLARHLLTQGLESLEAMEWRGWRVRRDDHSFVVTAP